MEIRNRNVTAVGLLVLVGGALFVWGLTFLLGNPMLVRGMTVNVALENGAGLKRSDRVNLNGVQVGTVRDVVLRGPRQVMVRLRLENDLRLPEDTRVSVRGDVFGAHTVELIPGSGYTVLEESDTLRGAPTPELPDLVLGLSDQARSVLAAADSLLSPRAVADVHATASVLPAGAQELRGAFAELRQAAAALRRSAEAFEGAKTGPAIAQAITEIEGSARAFGGAAVVMERSLGSMASVLEKIDRGDGTLGKLVNDTTLYGELQAAAREVRALASDIRERPSRYVSIKVF